MLIYYPCKLRSSKILRRVLTKNPGALGKMND